MALSQEPPAKGPKGTNQTNAAAPAREADTCAGQPRFNTHHCSADISQTECREIVSRARERQFRRHRTIFLESKEVRIYDLVMLG